MAALGGNIKQQAYKNLKDLKPFGTSSAGQSLENFDFPVSQQETLLGKKPGSLGSTKSISLPNMRITEAIVGLSSGYCCTLVPSVTTNEIDKAVHQMIIDAGAYPSPLGYGGFPKNVCTSVNECMCHGIPDSRQLQNSDIINIVVTVYLNVCF
ncbi:hypothetical protein AHAS_Ahas14G0161800 [Arachis hypogaea]